MASYVHNLKKDFGLKYDAKDVGKRIKELRQMKKMTANFLAHKSFVDCNMIVRAERGINEPMLSTLLRIIQGLEIQPAELAVPGTF